MNRRVNTETHPLAGVRWNREEKKQAALATLAFSLLLFNGPIHAVICNLFGL
jgi:hypothetical protein